MNTGMRLRRKGEQGQAMVEFALVLPLLLVLIVGIVQFGVLFHNYVTLTDAVRAGARQASVSRTLGDPQGATKSRVKQSAAGSRREQARHHRKPRGIPWRTRPSGRRAVTSPFRRPIRGVSTSSTSPS